MIKKFACLIIIMALGGCATVYTYNGQKYNSNEKLQQAVDAHVSSVLSGVMPLPTPLTQRKLIFAIPTAAAFSELDAKNFIKAQGREFNEQQKEMNLNLNRSKFKNIKVFFDAPAATQIPPVMATSKSPSRG